MSEDKKLRPANSDPLASAIIDLDSTNKSLAQNRQHANEGGWSTLKSDHIRDALVYSDDSATISRLRNQGYYLETEVLNKMHGTDDKKDFTVEPSEHVSGISGKKMAVMITSKARYDARQKAEEDKRNEAWVRSGETSEDGKSRGFVPYNGHSTRPPPGSKVEIEHEEF